MSVPYKKKFGLLDDQRGLGLSPDGPVASELSLILGAQDA